MCTPSVLVLNDQAFQRVIESLKQQVLPEFQRDDERIVYRLGKAIYEYRHADAVSTFGEPAVVELIGVYGYYAFVAMTLNVFAVRRDGDAPLPFPEQ